LRREARSSAYTVRHGLDRQIGLRLVVNECAQTALLQIGNHREEFAIRPQASIGADQGALSELRSYLAERSTLAGAK
jgi:hypothetical protein